MKPLSFVFIGLLGATIITPQGELRNSAGEKVGIVKPNPLGGFDIYAKDGSTRLGYGRYAPDGKTIEIRGRDGSRGLGPTKGKTK